MAGGNPPDSQIQTLPNQNFYFVSITPVSPTRSPSSPLSLAQAEQPWGKLGGKGICGRRHRQG